MRNIRTLNQTANQKIESQKVLTRMGDLSYRDLGVFARMFLIDQGKALIMGGGLIVSATTGMTVSVSAGKMFQRIDSGDVIPGIVDIVQTIALDAASGSPRVDTIQCQITAASARTDSAEVVTDPETGQVSVATVYRDKSYIITIGKLTGSTTATPGTAGVLTGTVSIAGTINCSVKYILNICDGEDGNFSEINIQGANPAATTLAEIVAKINAAVGRTMASTSVNHLVLTGYGTGQTSYFEVKPPSDSATDAFAYVTGVAAAGFYNYIYQGTNQWVKLAEIAVGSATTTIVTADIKDLTAKSSWVSGDGDVFTRGMTPGTWNTGKTYTTVDYVFLNDALYQCAVAHTAGVFYTDFAAGKWNMVNNGAITKCDDSSESATTFARLQTLLNKSINSGSLFSNPIVSTYSLVHTKSNAYLGGVLAPNGDIHFVPANANVGQKISAAGVVSTYSLVYTTTLAYAGGVLASNGDIHFIPARALVGQKISTSGVVSTYSLVYTYTTTSAYAGGVLALDGSIHFVPFNAAVGQKISSAGVISTYTLVYTFQGSDGIFSGGVLAPNGDIHFVPRALVGQKISAAGVVSTYSLVYTSSGVYAGGVLALNGDIHFVPFSSYVGQKISAAGVVSTYSLVYTTSSLFSGGVLAPDGSVYFIPGGNVKSVGEKISPAGVVSTYSLVYTTSDAYSGGILDSNGNIHFIPYGAAVGQKIQIFQGIPWSPAMCMSPYFNKF
jgi:hypothetical protein